MMMFAKNVLLLKKNTITDFFFNLEFSIDKFHFKNHVDLYCQENFNPNTTSDLKDVNTEICEQLYVHVNQYRNCKSNERGKVLHVLDLPDELPQPGD